MKIISPLNQSEYDAYYHLRWRLLRRPWGKPMGSEKDALEKSAFHLLALTSYNKAIGVGRVHFVSKVQCQIRYMAVVFAYQRQGVGSQILHCLEDYADANGAKTIILNARESALDFYLKRGYTDIGEGATLFQTVKHVTMLKTNLIS